MALKSAYIEILSGQNKGGEYPLGMETIHIGRSGDNDIILEDSLASRHHAHITHEDGNYFVIDLSTANGTFVNQKRILNQQLHHGDVIQIGKEMLRFIHPRAQDQKIAQYEQDSTLQRESISEIQATNRKTSPARLMLYGCGMLFMLLAVWIAMQPSSPTDRKTAGESDAMTSGEKDEAFFKTLPELKKEAYNINKSKGDLFYESGYRDFIEKNYLRALEDFKTALELYPDHLLARLYLDKTEIAISDAVDANYKAALVYFDSGQYRLTIFHFKQVMHLLNRRRPSSNYCARRQERSVAAENPDYEKYCNAKQKISEAKAKMIGQ